MNKAFIGGIHASCLNLYSADFGVAKTRPRIGQIVNGRLGPQHCDSAAAGMYVCKMMRWLNSWERSIVRRTDLDFGYAH